MDVLKKYIVLSILFVLTSSVNAQDVHLSQFYLNDIHLNPAFTANFDGSWRFTGNYRTQWGQINNNPLQTIFGGVEKKFSTRRNDIGLGLLLVRDQFDAFQTNLNKVFLSGSYGLKFKNDQKIMIGIQSGIFHRSVDPSNNLFGDQWSLLNGDFTQATVEATNQNDEIDVDLNIGLAWTKRFKKFQPTLGIAGHHVNTPEDTYFTQGNIQNLAVRYAATGEFIFFLKNFQIEPRAALMFTTRTNDLLYGANFRYILPNTSKPISVYAGIFNRGNLTEDNDALIPKVGARIDRWELGASFDYNTSTLSEFFNQKTALEFAVRYTIPEKESNYHSFPCEIY